MSGILSILAASGGYAPPFGSGGTTVPDKPTNVAATAGDSSATVTFTAPNNGGSAITGYTVKAFTGGVYTGISQSGVSTTITVTGLTNGTAYTFTVKATNAIGTGLESTASSSISPTNQTFVDDVFSTYLYTGNGSTQTITNGIDLAGKGGLVWGKSRSNTRGNEMWDTARGANKLLITYATAAEITYTQGVTVFNNNGFTVGSDTEVNENGTSYASWTFRKAAKFFDVVTYTGDGTTNKVINHNLGSVPGMIITKRTDGTGNWTVWHRAYSNDTKSYMYLNLTDALAYASGATPITIDASSFTIGTNQIFGNGSGWQYVAYLYAHDTSSTGIIQCGSFTTDGSGNATVNLGWEPQFFLTKCATNPGFAKNWSIYDTMRGWVAQPSSAGNFQANLVPNTTAAESTGNTSQPKSTGVNIEEGIASQTFIYMAIRRPNKPPTTGTQVFSPITSNDDSVFSSTNFPVDSVFEAKRSGDTYNSTWWDRLRGAAMALHTSSTMAEANFGGSAKMFQSNTGVGPCTLYGTGINVIQYAFKRAPGFFDEVCYTGTGASNDPGRLQNHNLTVAPELIITKKRSAVSDWTVTAYNALGSNKWCALNDVNTYTPTTPPLWIAEAPTSTVYNVGGALDSASATFVTYLFATLAGISKVGSYTGNGGTQAIPCGFTSGSRFVMIKRTDSTGDWLIVDSARGINANQDPLLKLNSTAAEVTTDDWIDADTSGFVVNQTSAANANVSGATYIFLAVA